MNPFKYAMMRMATMEMTATIKNKIPPQSMHLHGKYAGICTAC